MLRIVRVVGPLPPPPVLLYDEEPPPSAPAAEHAAFADRGRERAVNQAQFDAHAGAYRAAHPGEYVCVAAGTPHFDRHARYALDRAEAAHPGRDPREFVIEYLRPAKGR